MQALPPEQPTQPPRPTRLAVTTTRRTTTRLEANCPSNKCSTFWVRLPSNPLRLTALPQAGRLSFRPPAPAIFIPHLQVVPQPLLLPVMQPHLLPVMQPHPHMVYR